MDKEEVLKVKELRNKGLSFKEIAAQLLISKSRANYLYHLDMNNIEKRIESKKLFEKKVCELAKKVDNINQLCKIIDLYPTNVNYNRVKKILSENNVDISHFKTVPTKHNFIQEKKPLKEILVKNSLFNRRQLKHRLLKEGIKEYRCEKCQRTEWEGNPIPLELHHINGDNKDNRIENLQLLCPNCHSITDNYCGRKLRKNRIKKEKAQKQIPNKEILLEDFIECGTLCGVGKKHNVSDKTIAKWFSRHGLPSSSIELRNLIKKTHNVKWNFSSGNPETLKKESAKKRKRVSQYSIDGKLIKIYEKVCDTEKDGFNARLVTDCCKHRAKKYKGFIWEYTDI